MLLGLEFRSVQGMMSRPLPSSPSSNPALGRGCAFLQNLQCLSTSPPTGTRIIILFRPTFPNCISQTQPRYVSILLTAATLSPLKQESWPPAFISSFTLGSYAVGPPPQAGQDLTKDQGQRCRGPRTSLSHA